MLHTILKILIIFILAIICICPFIFVGASYFAWKLSDYPIGRDTVIAWNDGQIQLMTNYDDSSYSLYWKGDIVCTDIKSYEQDKDWLVFISNTNQYVVDIQSQTISMTNIETVTNNAIEKQRKS